VLLNEGFQRRWLSLRASEKKGTQEKGSRFHLMGRVMFGQSFDVL
jgi:hypothetical protein